MTDKRIPTPEEMESARSKGWPTFNHDLRDEDGRILLCLCALGDAIRDVDKFGGDPALIVERARDLIEDIEEMREMRR